MTGAKILLGIAREIITPYHSARQGFRERGRDIPHSDGIQPMAPGHIASMCFHPANTLTASRTTAGPLKHGDREATSTRTTAAVGLLARLFLRRRRQ